MKINLIDKICKKVVLHKLKQITKGNLTIHLPSKEVFYFGDKNKNANHLYIRNNQFFSKLIFGGNIGLGESYTDGDWDTNNITDLLAQLIENIDTLKKTKIHKGFIKRLYHLLKHQKNRNTRRGSKKNIYTHYDLGNKFYKLFLDNETMMYSSGVFNNKNESLPDAQKNKIHKLIELGDLRKEHHVLEIGCGWGGFAIEAVKKTGCKVTAITISNEQYKFTCEKIISEGLENNIKVKICDYRDIDGLYDRIVSIEMLEAVGPEYYGTYFRKCDKLLKPNGRVVLQVITIPEERYDSYKRNPDWIQKHIFPGGMLPSLSLLNKAIKDNTMLNIEQIDDIGMHYVQTLSFWKKRFINKISDIEKLGFDKNFQRKWIYYLSYCEAGFKTKFTNDLQILIFKP